MSDGLGESSAVGLPSGGAAPEIDVLRESVTTMALCGRGFDEVSSMLRATASDREAAIANEYSARIFSGKARVTEVQNQITDVDRLLENIKVLRARQGEREATKRDRLGNIALLQEEIRQKRRLKERERYRDTLDEMGRRLQLSEERLTTKQRVALEQQLAVWQRQRDEDNARADTEGRVLSEIEGSLTAARDRVRPLLDHRITKTVAGFLLWVGYGSFAAIGSTIALLLPSIRADNSPLAEILTAVRTVIAGYPASWPLAQVFGVSLIAVGVLALVFAGMVVSNDLLLRWFDPDWRREARGARSRQGKTRDPARRDLTVIQPVDIRRPAYVQMIAALPYVLITGAIACLLAVSGHPSPGTLTGTGLSATTHVSGSIVATYLGTVIALLMTGSFTLYVIKVIDRREAAPSESRADQRNRWLRGWEFLAVPFIAVIAIIYATVKAKSDDRVWGVLAIFMLLSCLAVAYGVIFRGLFYNVDRLERDRRRALKTIADLRSSLPPDPDDDDELREIRSEVKRHRDAYASLDALQWSGLVGPEDEPHIFDLFRRKKTGPPKFSLALDVTDADAAPDELKSIATLNEEIAAIDLERSSTAEELSLLDPRELVIRRDRLIDERDARLAAAEALEFERRKALWEFKRKNEMQLIDLRGAYELALRVKPWMSTVAPR